MAWTIDLNQNDTGTSSWTEPSLTARNWQADWTVKRQQGSSCTLSYLRSSADSPASVITDVTDIANIYSDSAIPVAYQFQSKRGVNVYRQYRFTVDATNGESFVKLPVSCSFSFKLPVFPGVTDEQYGAMVAAALSTLVDSNGSLINELSAEIRGRSNPIFGAERTE